MYALAVSKEEVGDEFMEFGGVEERGGEVESLIYMVEFGHVVMEIEGRAMKRRNRSHWRRRYLNVFRLGYLTVRRRFMWRRCIEAIILLRCFIIIRIN